MDRSYFLNHTTPKKNATLHKINKTKKLLVADKRKKNLQQLLMRSIHTI